MAQESQDASPNAPKLVILGVKLANIAPSCRQLGAHVRSSWRLRWHLESTWLRFGSILGAIWSAECSQDAQDAAKRPEASFGHRFFKILGPILIRFLNMFLFF